MQTIDTAGYLHGLYYISVAYNGDFSLENPELQRFYIIQDSVNMDYVLDCVEYKRLFQTVKYSKLKQLMDKHEGNFLLCLNNLCKKDVLKRQSPYKKKHFAASLLRIKASYKDTLKMLKEDKLVDVSLPFEMICEVVMKMDNIFAVRNYLNMITKDVEKKKNCFDTWKKKNIVLKKLIRDGRDIQYYETKKGIKHGKYNEYITVSGKKIVVNESTYSFGELNGKYETFYKNGHKNISTTYKNGKMDGKYEKWYDNDQKWESTTYKNGKKDGKYKAWHINGQSWETTTYKDGKKDGKYEKWWSNGQRSVLTTYKDGKIDGKYEEWWDNGQRCILTTFKDGKEDGKYESWHNNGKIEILTTFKDGKLHGSFKKFSPYGMIIEEGTYINDEEGTGKKYDYYRSNKLKEEITYKDEKLVQKLQYYAESGKIKFEVNYKDGKIHGICKKYDSKGNLTRVYYYENGFLKSFEKWKDGEMLAKEKLLKPDEIDLFYEDEDPVFTHKRHY